MRRFDLPSPRRIFRSGSGTASASTALVAALIGIGLMTQPADARRRSYQPEREEPRKVEDTQSRDPVGPLYGVVSLADQHVTFYDAKGVWARSRVSTGQRGYATPAGVFTILEKNRHHRSNIYSGAPMPFMQRLTWTGVALHLGVVPNHPASHGCVRLPAAFAQRLFAVTSLGQRVVIAPQDIAPVEIAHAKLPAPKLLPLPGVVDDRTTGAPDATPGVEPVALSAGKTDEPKPELVAPDEYVDALKGAAMKKGKAAAQARKAAVALAGKLRVELRQADRTVAVAEARVKRVNREVEAVARASEKMDVDEAMAKAVDQRVGAVEAKLADAETVAGTARNARSEIERELVSAQEAIRAAVAEGDEAIRMMRDATSRTVPVSILISRKTGRLYVRQGTAPLFDMPVTIKDVDRPLGTHLFIATRAGDNKASLNWVGITPPAAIEVKYRRHSSRRGRRVEPLEPERAAQPFPETAAAALDRIEIPADVKDRIGERLFVGSTLILSDVASNDGKFPMDFQILARTVVRD
ncbi:L,D-transpeptidase family protein [Rhodomicrobium sp. Az07]|uniref:L,D-transpeptidase family protein n=1 Tax=Rhodomicrobium sp. Az07 TaxID=2839034 RepID=UPI001BE713DF|nr:L,D-transpeptidase family protein [Rhodomicrobium sp. Az07]MBT3071549.1 L,D-transpeptidase family protein [Rhodomicrobium sp. Az07]